MNVYPCSLTNHNVTVEAVAEPSAAAYVSRVPYAWEKYVFGVYTSWPDWLFQVYLFLYAEIPSAEKGLKIKNTHIALRI